MEGPPFKFQFGGVFLRCPFSFSHSMIISRFAVRGYGSPRRLSLKQLLDFGRGPKPDVFVLCHDFFSIILQPHQ
jgi:hypothetical protein